MNMDSFEDIKVLMDSFDPASLLPDLTSLVGTVTLITRLAVLAGPLVLLALGMAYLFLSPKEANHHFGYRCYFGMGSVEAWRFTQRLAGIVWGVMGLVLTGVMFVITLGYGGKSVMEIISSGFVCMIVELVLILASCLAINLTVMARYNRNGSLRSRDY